jgi:ubiquitin-like 1-activating enzyme E1 A
MTKRPHQSDGETPNKKQIMITADELKLYDRQIRLWGMEAQNRLRNARVLVAGMTALANEILKNIVLAGVCHVSLVDESTVQEEDLGSQFFLRESDLNKNVAIV